MNGLLRKERTKTVFDRPENIFKRQHHVNLISANPTEIPTPVAICHVLGSSLPLAAPANVVTVVWFPAPVIVAVAVNVDVMIGPPSCPIPDKIAPAISRLPVGLADGRRLNASVLLPTTNAFVPSDISVPSTMIPAAPGLIVVPWTTIAEEPRAIVSVPMVMYGARVVGGEVNPVGMAAIGIVEVPTTRPPELRAIGVSDTVIAELPRTAVWEPITNAEGLSREPV